VSADARQFLQAVIPWPTPGQGYVNLHDHLPGGPFKGVAVESIDAFMAALEKARAKERNLYFCISQQREAKPNGVGLMAIRNRLNATTLKAVCIDLDVGEEKGYATQKEALTALARFIKVALLPPPSAVVASGSGGFHVYWISSVPLIPAVWQIYADQLRALFDIHGLKVADPGCTTDAARVFRVPDTKNYKWNPPRNVSLLKLGGEYDFAAIFKVAAQAPATAAPPSGGFQVPARYQGKKVELLGRGAEPPPLAIAADVIPHCPFLLNTLRTGGKDRPEPQWRWALRCASFMEDGEKIAHKLSEGDDRYSVGETNRKFDEAVNAKEKYGWPSCATIAGLGTPECKTCPHFKRQSTPFKLQTAVLKESGKVSVPAKPTGPWWNALPHGYAFDKKEQLITCQLLKKKGSHDDDGDDDEKKKDKFETVPLFRTKIVAKPWVSDHPVGLNFKVQLDQEKVVDSFIPMVEFTRSKIMVALFREHIIPNSKIAPARFEDFMGSFVERMNSYINTVDQTPYGWVDKEGANTDDLPVGFCYGGSIFTNKGETLPTPFTDDLLKLQYKPCGKEERWHEAANLILKQNKPELEIILASAFAAPLMRFTGQPGAMVVVYSDASGAHKSTASKIGAAVWGHPLKSREVHGSSWKGSVKRLGVTRNLLGQWDDMQEIKEIKALADTALTLCQGHEGTKLQADREFHETGDWLTLCLACMNQSFVAWLIANTSTPVARLARVFEIKYEKQLGEGVINTLDADRMVGALERNYGGVGLKYAELLANNAAEIKELVKAENEALLASLGPIATADNSKTRYWLCACTTILAGTRLANEMGIELHYDAIKARLVKAFYENLSREKEEAPEHGSIDNTSNAMARLLRHFGDNNTLWTFQAEGGLKKGSVPVEVKIVAQPDRGDTIDCQAVTLQRELRISESATKDWCQKNNTNYDALKKGLRKHFGVDNQRHRVTLGAGTKYARMPQKILIIPVPEGSIFEEFLFARGGKTENQIS
jgi:hypothetical protein